MTKIHKDTGNTRKFLEGIHKVDKLFCPSISNFIWILSSNTGTSAATPLVPGARKVSKVLANKTHFLGFYFAGKKANQPSLVHKYCTAVIFHSSVQQLT